MKRTISRQSSFRLLITESESGIYLPIIAATFFAFILLIGYALDSGNLSRNRSRLQRSIDAAAIAAVNYYDGKNELYVQRAAEEIIAANLQRMNVPFNPVNIIVNPNADGDPNTNVLSITASVDVPLLLLRYVPGLGETRTVDAAARAERNAIILTLVLDVSSSMLWCWGDWNKPCFAQSTDPTMECNPAVVGSSCVPILRPIDDLREATKKFVSLFDEASDQIAIVLFDTSHQVLKPMSEPFNKSVLLSRIDSSPGSSKMFGTGGNSNTDIEEGLIIGRDEFPLANPVSGAKRAIVLMTDGSPNFVRNANDPYTLRRPDLPGGAYYCSAGPTPDPGPGEMECRKQFLTTMLTADTIRSDGQGIKFYVIGLGRTATCTDLPFQGAANPGCTSHLKPIFLRRLANDRDAATAHGDPAFPPVGANSTPYGITPLMNPPSHYGSVDGPEGEYVQTPNSSDLDDLLLKIGQNIKGRLID